MRIFVGIPFPEKYKKNLKKIKNKWVNNLLSKVKWTEEKNFHLTLFFIGEVDAKKVEEIKSTLENVSAAPFLFQAGGGGYFPDIKRPRVLWVGTKKGYRECIKLAEKISSSLQPIGIKGDDRPFKPHLTIGRIKYANLKDNWKELLKYLNELTWPQITIDRFILWQSILKPTGPVYRPIKEFELK